LREAIDTGELTSNKAAHHKDCKKFSENDVKSKDLDRRMREEVRSEVTALPMATFEKVIHILFIF
jgi:hypothetical protein